MAENETHSAALRGLFLGDAPWWYKASIAAFLVLNPLLLYLAGPVVTGWALLAEFLFTLALALSCHPLPAGGLLALEAVALGLASPAAAYEETVRNFPVLLLLMFMVAGIHFMKDLLRLIFTRLILNVRSKTILSLLFCLTGAVLSAFLDALTVMAVMVAVAAGFNDTLHEHLSRMGELGLAGDADERKLMLRQFRGFVRNLLMHGAVGTALGGVMTLVGEPQNLLIAQVACWDFMTFFLRMAPVTVPVFVSGLCVCTLVERKGLFGYGVELPVEARTAMEQMALKAQAGMTARMRVRLGLQALAAVWLVLALALHLTEVGLIGLSVIILLTATTGETGEHRIARAFEEAMPFVALLVVFFAVVAVIHEQHLFSPLVREVLALSGGLRLAAMYLANGLLSAVSDNVFVATVYITELQQAFAGGVLDRAQFDSLVVAVNVGTNIPSIATPNGQAAFLYLLTSALAPVIRLTYGRMALLALPYTLVLTLVGLAAVMLFN
ncbi:MAG: sodium/proton antiporter NhaB [Proteobacteria bacterium]|nr:sodium/proton antiporter NhaB [Pseudomonadota bacterium]MBU1594411.1 sodium/proton antiporter NhaB [Pseudomonadota bacterium]